MRYLLDTHSFLWYLADDPKLSSTADLVISDPANEIWISAACLWEIAIKSSLGKLRLAQPFGELIPHHLSLNSIEVLGIDVDHLSMVAQLPFHHRDPFDRLIAAQSLVERTPLVSLDPAFDDYEVGRIW